MEKPNFNVDSLKLSSDLKIVVDGNTASFINKSFGDDMHDGSNQQDVIEMIYMKCRQLDAERKKKFQDGD